MKTKGSRPKNMTGNENAAGVPRPEVATYLTKWFLPEERLLPVTRFGVIIGPSGTGKTSAVRELCNNNPHGVLYFEIKEPNSFVKQLSKELEIKTSPNTMLDLILSDVCKGYRQYHVLPDDQYAGFALVEETLSVAATVYTKEYNRVPVMFIDGVDLLAKRYPELCVSLITVAKILANDSTIKIVLVSSEGSIMPLLEKMSAKNRSVVYEIGDLQDAVLYLMKNLMSEDKAKEVVKCIGGRLVYLESTVKMDKNKELQWKKDLEMCNKIKKAFFQKC